MEQKPSLDKVDRSINPAACLCLSTFQKKLRALTFSSPKLGSTPIPSGNTVGVCTSYFQKVTYQSSIHMSENKGKKQEAQFSSHPPHLPRHGIIKYRGTATRQFSVVFVSRKRQKPPPSPIPASLVPCPPTHVCASGPDNRSRFDLRNKGRGKPAPCGWRFNIEPRTVTRVPLFRHTTFLFGVACQVGGFWVGAWELVQGFDFFFFWLF